MITETTKQDRHQSTIQKAQYVSPRIAVLGDMSDTENKGKSAVKGTEGGFLITLSPS